jgi:hypothetical protein
VVKKFLGNVKIENSRYFARRELFAAGGDISVCGQMIDWL